MDKEEIKRRKKYFPENGIEQILNNLKEVHGTAIGIGERGIQAVLWGARKDNWGILDQYRIITDALEEKLAAQAKSSAQVSTQ